MTEHPTNKKLEVNQDTPTPKRSLPQRLGAVFLIIALLTGGFLTARYLVATKPKAKKKPPQKIQTLVQVTELKKEDVQLIIETMGTVVPARQANLTAEITGTVVSVNKALTPGGLLQKGDMLATIDDRDYQFALTRSKNNLKKTEMDLKLEQGNQAVAKREWRLLSDVTGEQPEEALKELALREPQLAKIEATVAVSRSDVDQARLNLSRTRISAPFNAVVISKDIDVGSRVSSQIKIAELVGTDAFWIQLTVERTALQGIILPDRDGNGGSAISVQDTASGNDGSERPAHLLRLLGNLEPNGLMARLLISVDDPLSLSSPHPPLLLGCFVKALIQGKTLPGVFRVPRTSILPGNKVLLATKENTLTLRTINPIWRDQHWVYANQGLAGGERLITSPVASPIEGMSLTIDGQSSISPTKKNKDNHGRTQ